MREFKQIKVKDLTVNYVFEGEGFPVVFLMGLGNDITAYLQNPAILDEVAKNHKVLLFDNRGIGKTSLGDIKGTDMSVFADDAIALMDALGIEKAHFIGISMGGMIGQQLALDYPERVEKLVLGCTCAGGPTLVRPAPELYDYGTIPGKGRLEDLKHTDPLLMLVSPKFIEANPEAAEGIRAMVEATRDDNDNEGFWNQQIAIRKFNSYNLLPNVKAETLVISPKYDILIPPANGCLIATQIPNSHFMFLANSAHPMIEEIDIVAAKIGEFLA
jgi:pimeloyl-ACP methyl ester carboxylesterase